MALLTAPQRQQLNTSVQQSKHAKKMSRRESERDGKESVCEKMKDGGRKLKRKGEGKAESDKGHRRSVARAVAPRRIAARVVSCVFM